MTARISNSREPLGVVTVISPVARLPTVAEMEVALKTVKAVAGVPPKATAVAPVKLLPVMVTTVPWAPEVGVKAVMMGTRTKVKVGGVHVVLVAIPPGAVTANVPVVPLPTVALRVVLLVTEKEDTAVPPTVTADASVKFVPVRVTTVPGPPEVGVNEVRVGGT